MADQLRPDIESVKTIIFRACSAWETQTGRKLGDEASVLEFLRALKSGGLLGNTDQATARKVREALEGFELSPDTALSDILSMLGITGGSLQRFLTDLKNSTQRETLIKDAFAAGSPAETARALESIAIRNNPQSLFTSFLNTRPYEAGKVSDGTIIVTVSLIIAAIVIATLVFIALGPHIRTFFTSAVDTNSLYKGVTPDPGGDYA